MGRVATMLIRLKWNKEGKGLDQQVYHKLIWEGLNCCCLATALLCPVVFTTHKLGLPNGTFAQCNRTSRTNYSQGSAMCAKLSSEAQTGAIQGKIRHTLGGVFWETAKSVIMSLAL